MRKKLRKNQVLYKILALTALFVVATALVIIGSTSETSPGGRFVETASQATAMLESVVIAVMIIIGIGIYFILRLSEKVAKHA